MAILPKPLHLFVLLHIVLFLDSCGSVLALFPDRNKGSRKIKVMNRDGISRRRNLDSSKMELLTKDKLKQFRSDFCYGALHVHNNHLSILSSVYKAIFRVNLILVPVLLVTHAASPVAYARLIAVLTNVLQVAAIVPANYQALCNLILAVPLTLLFWSVFIPYVILAGWLPKLITSALFQAGYISAATTLEWFRLHVIVKPLIYFTNFIRKHQRGAPTAAFSMADYHIMAVSYSPVHEEIVFRFLLFDFFRKLDRNRKERNLPMDSSSSTTKDEPRWFGRHPPWVVVSSVLFAASHIPLWFQQSPSISDSLHLPQGLELDTSRLLCAVSHCTSALVLSLHVLSPVYLERGLVASIASHMALNVFFLHFGGVYFWIPTRLLARWFRRCLRKKDNSSQATRAILEDPFEHVDGKAEADESSMLECSD